MLDQLSPHPSFLWRNLAAKNAGVTVVIVAITRRSGKKKRLFSVDGNATSSETDVDNINAYLIPGKNIYIEKRRTPISAVDEMTKGSAPTDGGGLLIDRHDLEKFRDCLGANDHIVRRFMGS